VIADFEIAEEATSMNEEVPISPSKEIETAKPAGGGKGKKQEPKGTNPYVPKAQIPRGPIDIVPEKEAKSPAKSDPFITRGDLTKIYTVGAEHGSWNVDAIQAFVKKRFGCKVSELRVSQLPEVLRAMKDGE
jgi:hypothetical protein